MPSKALADFRGALALAEALYGFESGLPDPPDPSVAGQVELVRGTRGGAVVLMVGAFERFVREAVEEHLRPLGAMPPPKGFDRLPPKMQVRSVFKSLEHAMRGPRYGSGKGKVARLADIKRAASVIANGLVNAEALSLTDGNIGAEGLGGVLKNLGITDPFSALRTEFDTLWAKPEAQQFIHDKLDQIVNSRHNVAHAVNVLNISRADVGEGIRFLSALAQAIDGLLETYIQSL